MGWKKLSLHSHMPPLDDRIEKVQLPDMGSYRCAVISESHQTLSDVGNIQLEGEF